MKCFSADHRSKLVELWCCLQPSCRSIYIICSTPEQEPFSETEKSVSSAASREESTRQLCSLFQLIFWAFKLVITQLGSEKTWCGPTARSQPPGPKTARSLFPLRSSWNGCCKNSSFQSLLDRSCCTHRRWHRGARLYKTKTCHSTVLICLTLKQRLWAFRGKLPT